VSGATILPHGGTLVNRWATDKERQEWLPEIKNLKRIHLTKREISDLEMIGVGAFSPLEGFMGEADYRATRERMRLRNGLPWTIPVTLSVTRDEERGLHAGDDVVLLEDDDHPLGILHLAEKYDYDKKREAAEIYGTTDEAHPGVKVVYDQGEKYLGGKITLLDRPREIPFREHRLDPLETRALFIERGWKRIVAFQTRNPVHRAHEYIQKVALEITDGLLLHPLVGETKGDDIPAAVRMECYKVLLDKYYPKDRSVLSVLPANMRYAGPREAIFHAIIRKNYGCTHFIVGRDHAGFGSFYDPYASQRIFSDYGREELGIEPIFFRESFYCTRCGAVASEKTCPHGREQHITMSGTGVQDILRYGYLPPKEVLRPEVGQVILQGIQPKGVGPDGHAIKPVGDTIKGLFPSYLTHTRLGGPKRPQPLDPKNLQARDLEAALRDTRDNASRVYERVYETYASLFDIERGADLTLLEEARRKAIAIQEELIQALEQKVAIAPTTVEDRYMYQDREEAERELQVARKILDDLRHGADTDFRERVWNQRPYDDYRS